MSKAFTDLEEREILALAIALEEEDSRIYRDFAEKLKAKHSAIASILEAMSAEEFLRGYSQIVGQVLGK